MSTCISRHGEYSDHEPGDWCPRCGVFNEEAIVAERDRLTAENAELRRVIAGELTRWDQQHQTDPEGPTP